MFQEDRWPFIPLRLGEVIEKDTLAVIESGCCERLKKPLTILDYNTETKGFDHRIDSINPGQRFERFCALLRDEERVQGGNRACQECNIKEARISLKSFLETGNPFRAFACHMGLQEMTHIIQIRGHPVATLYSGQYLPPGGIEGVLKNVQRAGREKHPKIRMDESTRAELLELAKGLSPAPDDARYRLEREARHIQSIAEDRYRLHKYNWEQHFLDGLRRPVNYNGKSGLEQLRQNMDGLLGLVRTFCRCEYVVFFAGEQHTDTLLIPIGCIGIPAAIKENPPHFNWKKAGLPTDDSEVEGQSAGKNDGVADVVDVIDVVNIAAWGIRGDNRGYFKEAGCAVPTSPGNRYRGVLVFGPFAEPNHVGEEEMRFLQEIADIVGRFAFTELQVRYLDRERKRWQSTAKLLIHQLRTALTPITNQIQIGRARLIKHAPEGEGTIAPVVDLLKRAEDLSLQLAKSSRETLAGHVLQLEPEDMIFERYPLSVLVANCADGFTYEAQKRRRQLVIDKSVELLPEAEIDVARLIIALSNLIENALKYSYPGTTIYVRSYVSSPGNPGLTEAVIEVDSLGDEIRRDSLEYIFEEGTRGLTRAKMGRISGSGLGLWETRAVLEAHGGKIGVLCKPTSIHRPQGTAHHVVFSVNIPLGQKED